MSTTAAVVIDVEQIGGQCEVNDHREPAHDDDDDDIDSIVRRRRQKLEQRHQRRNRRRSYANAQSRDGGNSPSSAVPQVTTLDGEETTTEPPLQQCDVQLSSNGRRSLLTVPGDGGAVDGQQRNYDDADNGEEENVEGSGLPFPEYIDRAFYFLHQTTAPRSWCLKLVTWQYPLIVIFLPSRNTVL